MWQLRGNSALTLLLCLPASRSELLLCTWLSGLRACLVSLFLTHTPEGAAHCIAVPCTWLECGIVSGFGFRLLAGRPKLYAPAQIHHGDILGHWTWTQFYHSGTFILTRWLSWLECCHVHQKVAGLIPAQGIYLGCGFDPQSGTNGKQLVNVSLFLSQINKYIFGRGFKKFSFFKRYFLICYFL